MESSTSKPYQYYLTYSVLLGVISILVFLVDYYFFGAVQKLSYVTYLINIVFMVIVAIEIRKKCFEGYLSYGLALRYTFLTGLFAGIIASLFSAIYVAYINPGFVNEVIEGVRAATMKANPALTETQLDQAMWFTKMFFNPKLMFITGIFSSAFISFLFALIVSIFVKRNKPLEEF